MLRLSDDHWERIRGHFPEENIPDGRVGRKPIPSRRVLEAVLWILNTGAQWHMLPQCYLGKRPAEVELFAGSMGSIQREIRSSMQREGTPTMETGLERIAAKARGKPDLRFTSLAHHITRERVWENLCRIPKRSAPGVDGQTVMEAKGSFGEWVEAMLQSVHRSGYPAPDIRRVYIPKPGKQEKRPLGVPCVADRALQRSAAQVLSAIYEQDFLPCSFCGRPGRGAHHALATLNEVIAGSKVGWALEADLKNFFGSLSHQWLLRFVEHRVGDPRLISLIRRWLKAGVLEDGEVHPNEEGTPQGGSISIMLSIYTCTTRSTCGLNGWSSPACGAKPIS